MKPQLVGNGYQNTVVAPEFSSSPQNVRVIEENKVTVTLNCTVYGNPTPDVKWTKDEIELSKNDRINVSEIVGNTSSLTITNTVREDEGQYRCVASNSVNTTISSPGKLTVNWPFRTSKKVVRLEKFSLITNTLADVAISGSELKFVEISKQIQLTCQYTASPPVSEVQWVKDGNVIARNKSGIGIGSVNITQFTENQSQLRISSSKKQDEGNYTCFVKNAVGTSSDVTSVLIQVIPDPPQNITVDSKGSRVVSISWTPGSSGNSDIKNYTVEISEDNQNFSDVVCQGSLSNGACVVSSPSTTASLTGLFPWTTYNIRVFATNKIGRSNSSSILNVTTYEEVPSEAPSFDVTVLNSTAVNVSWQMLSKDKARGAILGYYVLYRVKENTPPWINKTVGGAGITSLLLGPLNEHTMYEFAMQAVNSKGVSNISALVEKTTDQHKPSGPPDQVTLSEVTSTSIKVTWTSVDRDDRNGIIKGYKVLYRALPNGDNVTTFDNVTIEEQGTERTLAIEGLNEFTNYSIRVLAFTVVGDGPLSGAKFAKTREDRHDILTAGDMRKALSERPVKGTSACVCEVDESKRTLEVNKIDCFSKLHNIQFGEKSIRAWRSYGIGRGKEISYDQLVSNDQGDTALVVSKEFFPFHNARVYEYTVPGTEGSNEDDDLDDSKMDMFECSEPGCVKSFQTFSELELHLNVGDHCVKDERLSETVYDKLRRDWAERFTTSVSITDEPQCETSTHQVVRDSMPPVNTVKPNLSPQVVIVTVVSSKSIFVSWSPVPLQDRNGIIKGYRVIYQALPNGNNETETVNITTNDQDKEQTLTLEELNEFTDYSIRVLAFTAEGDGPLSVAKVNHTLEDKPSLSPQAVVVTVESSRSIIVSWSPVLIQDRNGIIKGYKVIYQALPNGNNETKTVNITINDQDKGQTLTLEKLNEFTIYRIRVLAFTAVGDGPLSVSKVNQTLEDEPSLPPQAVVVMVESSRSIIVSWSPVPIQNRNGIIKGYQVIYQALPNGNNETKTVNITINDQDREQTLTLEKLNEFTNYRIRVLAFTAVGDGPLSVAKFKQTLEDEPSLPPQAVVVTVESSRSIIVSWSPVPIQDRNGIIKGYKVVYQALPNGNNETVNITINDQDKEQTLTLEELNEFTNYSIRVLAFTAIGDGSLSVAKVNQTLEDQPSLPPQAVVVTVESSRSIIVSWSPVLLQDRNGIIKGYKVLYQALPNGNNETETVNITSNDQDKGQTLTIRELNEFTNYSIRVLAFTAVGDGRLSAAKVNRTLEDKPTAAPSNVTGRNTSSTSILVEWDDVPAFEQNEPSGAPQNLSVANTTSTSIFVMWKEVRSAEQNGIIVRYNVSYRAVLENGSGGAIVYKLIDAPKLYVNLTGLTKDMHYSISVLASTIKEPEKPPQSVTVTTKVSSSIEVKWEAVPKDFRRGIITEYIILYNYASEGEPSEKNVSGDARQAVVGGLKQSTKYSIQILAATVKGRGPPSDPKFATTKDKDEETSEFPFHFIWGSVGAFAVLVCVVLIAIAIKRIRRKRKDSLVMERNNENNISMLEITPGIMNQLRDHGQQIPIEAPAEVPNSGAEEVVVVDNETYLNQMDIDRNWEIPRERLEILETKLGGGEFGVVKKGNYLRVDGNKLPVAVKMLKG
ncbi:Protein sidekick-2 [Stylophora pistillata]|uniref:Protein sidekick-2 n=2 Tax=Stylophora pistillata TaxID=50429 RepID=A0A2B4R8P4_STYPI|nr:Protein sidekick-2 [Stylophora pistillata]